MYTKRACLPNGKYDLVVSYEGGDGMCCKNGKGFYVLYSEGEGVEHSDGEFGSSHDTMFELGGEMILPDGL